MFASQTKSFDTIPAEDPVPMQNPHSPKVGQFFLDVVGNEFTVLSVATPKIMLEFADGRICFIAKSEWDYLSIQPC